MNQNNLTQEKFNIGLQLATVVKLKRQFVDTYIKNMGLSRTEWQALFWINKLGDCTQKELLANLDIDPGHLARILEKIEQKKYIIRSPLKGNRRISFIQMTKYCIDNIIPQILTALEKEELILLNGITYKDTKYFSELLSKLEKNLILQNRINIENNKKS